MDVLAALLPQRSQESRSFTDLLEFFTYNGSSYGALPFSQTLTGDREEIGNGYASYVEGAYKRSGIVFAVELVRMTVFAEARFMYRKLVNGRPGELHSTSSLAPLNDDPHSLLTRAMVDADFAGNHFALRQGNRVIPLRPDWMSVMAGGPNDVDPLLDPEAEIVGYLYFPGGMNSGNDPIAYLPNQIAHWAPIPDPLSRFTGMSWLTPVLREIQADTQATVHKQRFFENGATPNMVVTLDSSINPDSFQKWVDIFNNTHAGAANAYKTLFLGGGADVDVVGRDFSQLDFKATQGAGETRIAIAGGIHPAVIGTTDGMSGSTLNAGNYAAARRSTADRTFRSLWRSICRSYSRIVPVPRNSELWYDDRDIEFLQEDQKDNAEIQGTRAQSIRQLIDAGYESDSVVEAITNDDFSLLEHSGLFSVQLQEAGQSEQQPQEDNE